MDIPRIRYMIAEKERMLKILDEKISKSNSQGKKYFEDAKTYTNAMIQMLSIRLDILENQEIEIFNGHQSFSENMSTESSSYIPSIFLRSPSPSLASSTSNTNESSSDF